MRLSSRLLLVKYALKSGALRLMPEFYWDMRRFLYGWYEPELALLPFLADPKRPAFDIGAHFGLWLTAMLPHFAEIHAFEPVPRLAAVLRAGHGGKRVHVHELALSNAPGRTSMRIPIASLGRSTVEPQNRLRGLKDISQPIVEIQVATGRLDDLALPDPAFIKIDAEGHELAVLKGAEKLIARARPAMVIELEEHHFPDTSAETARLLDALGYVALRLPGSRNCLFLPHS
jgi:FkbM family methyltransferase